MLYYKNEAKMKLNFKLIKAPYIGTDGSTPPGGAMPL
jgi:hypothetical protein